MGKVEKVSIALTPELSEMVRQAVASGLYASASEVVREALRDWQQRQARRKAAIEEIGRLWDEGMASESIDADEAFTEVFAAIEAKKADRAA